jgi:hypothetical protein
MEGTEHRKRTQGTEYGMINDRKVSFQKQCGETEEVLVMFRMFNWVSEFVFFGL